VRVWPVPEVPTDCAVTDREGVRWIEDPGNGRWSAPDHPTWWPHPNALALLNLGRVLSLQKKYEAAIETYFRHPLVIVVTLVIGALLFALAEHKFVHNAPMEKLTLGRAIAIGASQTIALIPGVSRSGITIVTGMMCGLRRDEAARFSFLLATPITFGACLKKSLDLLGSDVPMAHDEKVALVVGILTSGICGWLVIRFLLNFLRRHSLEAFAWYRVILAAVVAAFLLF